MAAISVIENNFVAGLETLDHVVNILSDQNVTEQRAVSQLSSLIPKAYNYLTISLRQCEGETDRVSQNIEQMVNKVSMKQKAVKGMQTKVAVLTENVKCLGKQVENDKTQLEEAKRSLSSARGRLEEQENELEKRKKEQAVVAGVGAGLLFIPVAGWIVGGSMIAVSFTALEDGIRASRRNVESAENDERSCEVTLSQKEKQESDSQQELYQENQAKENAERQLQNLNNELTNLKRNRNTLVVLQEELRRSCHFLTTMWGKSRVLNQEAKCLYSLEPLFRPLKEIADMLELQEESKLKVHMLLTKDAKRITGSMVTKMLALSHKSLQIDFVDDLI